MRGKKYSRPGYSVVLFLRIGIISSKKPTVQAGFEPSASEGYTSILDTIMGKIKAAQTRAMMAVNHELIAVYMDIGRMIYKQQQGSGWGDSVVDQLAKDLQKSFPGIKGFSSKNLWNMRDSLFVGILGTRIQDSPEIERNW